MFNRGVRVQRTIGADVATVWDALADIAAHVEWMADARAIRFTSDAVEGVGTTFDCDTRVGPLRLTDRMEVTEWSPERSMAVRHVGVVTGEGRFSLQPATRGRTRLSWEETLRFPWWIPARPASVVLKLIWRGNLRRFEQTLPTSATRGARRRGRRRRPAG
jgi:carbon monoxide dehydrogenase subunit G